MNEWKFQQRRKKRGTHCTLHGILEDGTPWGRLCGCGTRTEVSKKHKNRIVKRYLKRQLKKNVF